MFNRLTIALLRFLPRPRQLVMGVLLLPLVLIPLILVLGPSQSIALGAPDFQERGTRCVLAVPVINKTEQRLAGLSLTVTWPQVATDWQGNSLDRQLDLTVPELPAGAETMLIAAPLLPERCTVYKSAPRAEVSVTECRHDTLAATGCRHAIRRGSDGEVWKFD